MNWIGPGACTRSWSVDYSEIDQAVSAIRNLVGLNTCLSAQIRTSWIFTIKTFLTAFKLQYFGFVTGQASDAVSKAKERLQECQQNWIDEGTSRGFRERSKHKWGGFQYLWWDKRGLWKGRWQ